MAKVRDQLWLPAFMVLAIVWIGSFMLFSRSWFDVVYLAVIAGISYGLGRIGAVL